MQRFPRASSSRGASSARARPVSRTRYCGASPPKVPSGTRRCPRRRPDEAALRHSLPDWIAELWFEAYGDERARALCAAANRAPCTLALAQSAA